ncbi:MAG TPA: hypothetical protein VIL85_09435 [Thermomicrobiales bacterium]
MADTRADTQPTDLTVEGLLAATEAEFGDRLDDEGRANVRRQIERIVANSRALSAYALTNDQEPDFTFTARREG